MYSIILVILFNSHICLASQSDKELPLASLPLTRLSYFDSKNGRCILEFEAVNTNNPLILYPDKTNIHLVGERFIKILIKYADSNTQTSHYQRSLKQIEDHFFDIGGFLKTNRSSQTLQLIETCKIIDRSASRFLNEMGGRHWQVEGWQISQKTDLLS